MSALPWVKLYTDLPTHRKSVLLAVETGDRRAWTYVAALILWVGKNAGDGYVRGASASGLIEMAVDWTGERGRLVSGMLAAGFLEVAADGDGYQFHGWAEEQGAHVAKMERDKRKPRGNKPSLAGPADVPRGTREGPASVPRGTSAGLSPLSTLSSSQEGCGEERPEAAPARAASKPEAAPLGDRLDDAFLAAKDAAYDRSFLDENAMGRLLTLGAKACPSDPEGEVLRRWRIALEWQGYPSCSTWLEFSKLWNHFAKAKATGKPADVTRGVVRADASNHDPVGIVHDW